jgi:hypothetical protein
LKIKPKGRHFDTTEVMEAESQTLLNSLTEHGFQDPFIKWRKRWAEGPGGLTRWQCTSSQLKKLNSMV